MYHFIPMAIPMGTDSASAHISWASLLFFLLWLIPFAIAFIWHRVHDHRHNHKLEKRLDKVITLLKQIADKK